MVTRFSIIALFSAICVPAWAQLATTTSLVGNVIDTSGAAVPGTTITAVNAARLVINGDGTHKVSLDKAIKTMRDTGRDMKSKYKETARGGLAVNVVEC